jgi:cysteine desulfurase
VSAIGSILYLNHGLTKPLDPRVARVMAALLEESARDACLPPADTEVARQVLAQARQRVAELAGASPEEVLFTSGATEANNLALKGSGLGPGDEILVGATEHSSVQHPARTLEKHGVRLRWIPVDRQGRIDPAWVEGEIDSSTRLVAVMAANNETGTLHPIGEIGRLCRAAGVRFLVDAAAAAGQIPLEAQRWGADLLSLSAHKLGGPRGVGALVVREGVRLFPLIEGGVQEGGRRGGTENLPGIAGFGEAASLALRGLAERAASLGRWRDRLWRELNARVQGLIRHSAAAESLPGHLSFSAPGAEGEALQLGLWGRGVAASSGSECYAHAGKPSHVLRAMGVSKTLAQCSLLFSVGEEFEERDIERAAVALAEVAGRLRALSPDAPEEELRLAQERLSREERARS